MILAVDVSHGQPQALPADVLVRSWEACEPTKTLTLLERDETHLVLIIRLVS